MLGLVAGLSAAGGAQGTDPYIVLVRSSAEGYEQALAGFVRMSDDDIERGVRACKPPACTAREQQAAAMLHADAAETLIPVDVLAARRHVRAGTRLVDDPKGSLYAGKWIAYAALMLRANGQGREALRLAEEALRRHGQLADFHLAIGVILEQQAIGALPDLRGAIMRPGGVAGASAWSPMQTRTLITAGAELRRAVEIDPTDGFARVHLGWNHVMADDTRFTSDLEPVIEDGPDEMRYLALLARGTGYEHAHHQAEAEADYRRAFEEFPDYQAGCLALAYVQRAGGNTDGAADTASACLDIDEPAGLPDPWRTFQIGLMDQGTTAWLRAESSLP